MLDHEFLRDQERRIKRRIAACEIVIQKGRIDAAFKAKKVLPAQRMALHRLRAGAYGTCIECGGEIGKSRLKSIPSALRCISCQQTHEE
jgi:RNA polymerase-binding transcription factor DksA